MEMSSLRQQEQEIRTTMATDAAAPSLSVQTSSAPSATAGQTMAPSAVGQKPIRAARASDLQLYGTPGTLPSLVLRAVQFLAAALALTAVVSADDFFTVPGFSFLVAATATQSVWSFSLGILDVDAMITKSTLTNHWIASLMIFGDAFTAAATFCAASVASGVVIYIHYDAQTCAKEHCDNFQAAVTRTFISFAALVPSLWVNWVRSCASTLGRTAFPADQLLLYSNGVCFIVATIALVLYAGNGTAGRVHYRAVSFSVIASSMQLAASALGIAGQLLSRHFGSGTPVPDWPLLCVSVIAVEWLLAFWTAGTACASTGLIHFLIVNEMFSVAVNVIGVVFCVLSLAVGALSTLAACATSHLSIKRWLRRRAQNQ